ITVGIGNQDVIKIVFAEIEAVSKRLIHNQPARDWNTLERSFKGGLPRTKLNQETVVVHGWRGELNNQVRLKRNQVGQEVLQITLKIVDRILVRILVRILPEIVVRFLCRIDCIAEGPYERIELTADS